MRSDPIVTIVCNGGDCYKEIGIVILESVQAIPVYVDAKLTHQGWKYYGNLDFCPECNKNKNHVILKGIYD